MQCSSSFSSVILDFALTQVKSVFAEGIPASWDEEKVRECFKKFGEIERIVVARNIKSSKRKDFAFVNYKSREAALLCIGSFDEEELTENGSKVLFMLYYLVMW